MYTEIYPDVGKQFTDEFLLFSSMVAEFLHLGQSISDTLEFYKYPLKH